MTNATSDPQIEDRFWYNAKDSENILYSLQPGDKKNWKWHHCKPSRSADLKKESNFDNTIDTKATKDKAKIKALYFYGKKEGAMCWIGENAEKAQDGYWVKLAQELDEKNEDSHLVFYKFDRKKDKKKYELVKDNEAHKKINAAIKKNLIKKLKEMQKESKDFTMAENEFFLRKLFDETDENWDKIVCRILKTPENIPFLREILYSIKKIIKNKTTLSETLIKLIEECEKQNEQQKIYNDFFSFSAENSYWAVIINLFERDVIIEKKSMEKLKNQLIEEKNYWEFTNSLFQSKQKLNKKFIIELINQDILKPETQDKDGHTLWFWAAKQGHLELTQALLETGANPFQADKNGQTALELATKNNQHQLITFLEDYCRNLQKPVDPLPVTPKGQLPPVKQDNKKEEAGSLNKLVPDKTNRFYHFNRAHNILCYFVVGSSMAHIAHCAVRNTHLLSTGMPGFILTGIALAILLVMQLYKMATQYESFKSYFSLQKQDKKTFLTPRIG